MKKIIEDRIKFLNQQMENAIQDKDWTTVNNFFLRIAEAMLLLTKCDSLEDRPITVGAMKVIMDSVVKGYREESPGLWKTVALLREENEKLRRVMADAYEFFNQMHDDLGLSKEGVDILSQMKNYIR